MCEHCQAVEFPRRCPACDAERAPDDVGPRGKCPKCNTEFTVDPWCMRCGSPKVRAVRVKDLLPDEEEPEQPLLPELEALVQGALRECAKDDGGTPHFVDVRAWLDEHGIFAKDERQMLHSLMLAVVEARAAASRERMEDEEIRREQQGAANQ